MQPETEAADRVSFVPRRAKRTQLSACGVHGGARQSSRSRCHLRIDFFRWCVNSWALGLFAFVVLGKVCFLNARGSQKADCQHQCVLSASTTPASTAETYCIRTCLQPLHSLTHPCIDDRNISAAACGLCIVAMSLLLPPRVPGNGTMITQSTCACITIVLSCMPAEWDTLW